MKVVFLNFFLFVTVSANTLFLQPNDIRIRLLKIDSNRIVVLTRSGKFDLNIEKSSFYRLEFKGNLKILDYSLSSKHTLSKKDKETIVEFNEKFQIINKIPIKSYIKYASFNMQGTSFAIERECYFRLVKNKKITLLEDEKTTCLDQYFDDSRTYMILFSPNNDFILYETGVCIGFSRTDNSGSRAIKEASVHGGSHANRYVAIHPNSKKFYIGGSDGKLYTYDVIDNWYKFNGAISFTKNPLEYVTLNQKGTKLLVADKNEILIINSKNYKIENRLKIDKNFKATRYDFLANNKAILGYNKNKVLLKNIKTGKTYAQIQVYKDGTYIIKDEQGNYSSNNKNTPYIQIKEDDGTLRDLKQKERDTYFKDDLIKKLIFN